MHQYMPAMVFHAPVLRMVVLSQPAKCPHVVKTD
jgi:hypothetical protein